MTFKYSVQHTFQRLGQTEFWKEIFPWPPVSRPDPSSQAYNCECRGDFTLFDFPEHMKVVYVSIFDNLILIRQHCVDGTLSSFNFDCNYVSADQIKPNKAISMGKSGEHYYLLLLTFGNYYTARQFDFIEIGLQAFFQPKKSTFIHEQTSFASPIVFEESSEVCSAYQFHTKSVVYSRPPF